MMHVAELALRFQRRTARLMTTMARGRTKSTQSGLGNLRAPLGTDAFNVEFVLQAGACIDWHALGPWIAAVDARLGATLPTSFYQLATLARWFDLDVDALRCACMRRTEFRRFIGAPLHGPLVDLEWYREFEPSLRIARGALGALNRLIAAIELQLVERGFFPPTAVLGRLNLDAAVAHTEIPTVALPRAPHPVASACETSSNAGASPHAGLPDRPRASSTTHRQAMLVWPWGEITPIERRLHIGRDTGCAARARHLGADRKISRRHAVISPASEGVLLQDLGSTNGTYIDDAPMRHSESRLLTEDAAIKFGTDLVVMLVFVTSGDGEHR